MPLFGYDVRDWVNVAGESLVALDMDGMARRTSTPSVWSISRALVEKRPALRRLNICSISACRTSSDILRSVGGHLRELTAEGKHMPGISARCPVLRELVLRTQPDDVELLRSVGSTLESLQVEGAAPAFARELLQLPLRDACPILSAISLVAYSGEERSASAELLCSYRDQLRFARIGHFPAELCQQVVAACPNMRTNAMVTYDLFSTITGIELMDCLSRLAPLGSSLKELSIETHKDFGVKELTEAAQACVNIETIHLTTRTSLHSHMLQGLLCIDKPLLKHLSVRLSGNSRGESFRELRNRIGNLRSFSFSGKVQLAGAFEAVVQGAPLLETVGINYDRGDETLFELAGDIVGTFLQCRNLRVLDVGWIEGDEALFEPASDTVPNNLPLSFRRVREYRRIEYVANLCCRSRHKIPSVNVRVGGVRYL